MSWSIKGCKAGITPSRRARIKIPMLMLNGRYDDYFPVETSQIPMFRLLGTPAEQKEHRVYEAGHLVPRNEMTRQSLVWYDRYLGPVSTP